MLHKERIGGALIVALSMVGPLFATPGNIRAELVWNPHST